jgi:hypothetical protein
MPCGCKQGRWAPDRTAVTAAANPTKGPRAPGYAAPSKNRPRSQGAQKKP